MTTPKDTTSPHSLPEAPDEIVSQVRDRYARVAEESTSCCGGTVPGVPGDSTAAARRVGYRAEELESIPDSANMGLGCGAPLKGSREHNLLNLGVY